MIPEHTYLDPEVDRTLDTLTNRHPVIAAYERFVHDRLSELAHRAFQHGASDAILSLQTSGQAAASLGVTLPYVKRLARKHEIGWNVGGDWLFRPQDVEQLRAILDSVPGRRGTRIGERDARA